MLLAFRLIQSYWKRWCFSQHFPLGIALCEVYPKNSKTILRFVGRKYTKYTIPIPNTQFQYQKHQPKTNYTIPIPSTPTQYQLYHTKCRVHPPKYQTLFNIDLCCLSRHNFLHECYILGVGGSGKKGLTSSPSCPFWALRPCDPRRKISHMEIRIERIRTWSSLKIFLWRAAAAAAVVLM